MDKANHQVVFLYLVLFLSGIAGLGYEMVWTRMLMVGLGHEIIAALAVVAAFFSGLALGAWTLDSRISRSSKPDRWYAGLELIIGVWAVALTVFIPAGNSTAHYLIGIDPSPIRHWALAFLLPLLILLPATFCMGGTLPAIERFFIRLRQQARPVGGLYAANTFGAVMGTLLTTYLFVPQLGFSTTTLVLAALNFLCSALVLLVPLRAKAQARSPLGRVIFTLPSYNLPGIIFITGLLGIGFEVLVIRVLSQVYENTVYSFSSILTMYLLGTAAGAGIYQTRAQKASSHKKLHYLLCMTSVLCLISITVLDFSGFIYVVVRSAAGGKFWGSLFAEMAVAGLIFLPSAMAMGATFSHLAQSASTPQGGLGRALGLNTLGSSIAPVLFGVALLPVLGPKNSLLIVSCGYAVLAVLINMRQCFAALAALGFAALIFFSPVSLQFVTAPDGSTILEHRDGVMAAVTAVEDPWGNRLLKVNDKFHMGGTATAFADKRLAHIPLLLHPHPATALFLGLGTGTTFSAAADHTGLQADGVELIPEIVPLLHYFNKSTGDFCLHKNLNITIADARRFVNATPWRYDVIIADLFHPARDGAGSLYTVEHFAAIRNHLSPSGIFCQWLPLYQLDNDMLRTIIRSFLSVYPDGQAYLAYYSLDKPIIGLLGGTVSLRYSTDWFEMRVKDHSLQNQLQFCRLNSFYELFGGFIADNKALAEFAGSGPLNTDDMPVVIFNAPRFAYADQQHPFRFLMELLASCQPKTEQILTPAATAAQKLVHQRLTSYWMARDDFLSAGLKVPQTNDLRLLLSSAQQPLLACVRTSTDFSAAYDPLLAMAQNLYQIDREAALNLLDELNRANPLRADAKNLRAYLLSN